MPFVFFRNVLSRPARIESTLDRLENHMSKITRTLLAINDQLNKAAEEITSKIAELETRDYFTDEDKAILSHIKAGAQTLDDIVPDDVAEEAEEVEKEEEAEEESEEAPAEEGSETDEDTSGDNAEEDSSEGSGKES